MRFFPAAVYVCVNNLRKSATLDEILDNKYGKKGNPKREKWEQEFEAFKLGVLLEEARIKLNMTQEELRKNVELIKRISQGLKIMLLISDFLH